jgi:hypothetical protein
MTTPANLRASRMGLGLSIPEAADILDMPPKTLENMERSSTHNVHARALDELDRLEEVMGAYIDTLCKHHPPVLCGFTSWESAMTLAPELAPLRSNSVHRMALAIAQAELVTVEIVEIIPRLYRAWLDERGAENSPLEREAWALAYLPTFRLITGGRVGAHDMVPK